MLMVLLAVFLTAGFSLSAAQASIMSAKMTTMAGMTTMGGMMTMPSDTGMATDTTAKGECNACLKGAGDTGNPMQCPPTCIAPVLALLPQGLGVTMVLRPQQPAPSPYPLFHGHAPPPDLSPPRPSNHA